MKTVREYSFHGRPRYVFTELWTDLRSEAAVTLQLWMEIPVFWLGSVLPWAVIVLVLLGGLRG